MDAHIESEDRALIAALAPELAVRTLRHDNGQFNDVLIVNDALVFRFPKSPATLVSLSGEVAILRALAGRCRSLSQSRATLT